MKQADIDRGIEHMMRTETSSRSQRGIILQLLGDLKGVSVSEMGKLSKSIGMLSTRKPLSGKRPVRSKMAQDFMTAPTPNNGTNNNGQDGAADNLEGVASLFDS